MLAAHAQALAGLARTADFRWWGDRVSLTVSIGAAQADSSETLANLLERAHKAAMLQLSCGRKPHYSRAGGAFMFAIIGIVVVIWSGYRRLPDGEGPHGGAGSAGRVLILGGAAMGTLLVANPIHIIKGVGGRIAGRAEGLAVRQEALSEHAEDDVPVPEQGAQRGLAERGDGR
jgi:hypothetical protein